MATKTLSTHAAAAKAIRQELKAAFPHTTFSVKARSFAGGDAVDVSWVDGPTYGPVDAIVSKYQQGHFDGMHDIYEYTNVDKSIPQVKYAHTHRDFSAEANVWGLTVVNARFGWTFTVDERGYLPRMSHYEFSEYRDVVNARTFGHCPACGTATELADNFCMECGKVLGIRN